jgi:predicted DNA-binding transcriptional regulator AlpA
VEIAEIKDLDRARIEQLLADAANTVAPLLIKVLSRRQTYESLGVSEKTWERLELEGDVPTKTRISQGRIGYRLIDIKMWLDARQVGAAS